MATMQNTLETTQAATPEDMGCPFPYARDV
jgi:hypothetical protein